ncbi:MAG TPA: aminotransferase class I/II-fold pyridoxal phosphate-dependent enzyme [Solirubrobacteraceae bacterium]|nr:aminotransferase class I/II-fold pyridoxal phosphate-dependent enzyme [Solirubrobacteraceae bacterium]
MSGAAPSLPVNPLLAAQGTYPFTRLREAADAAAARGLALIDFGVGEPREETPAFIRAALAEAITPVSTYPLAVGLPELRDAVAAWAGRRFGARLDPDGEVVPTLGSKEAIFQLAHVVVGPGRALVAVTTPGYPVPARGAQFAGADVVELPLRVERGFLPDPDDLAADEWARLALLWVNTPNNPTGAVAGLELLDELAARCRTAGAVLASDEAYSELWLEGDPPCSALQLADRANVAVFNTLSKRSSMPGYRSGFLAGDARLIQAVRRLRPTTGTTPQEFVQRASAAAWGDEAHVEDMRALYRAKRDVLLPALRTVGLEPVGGRGTFFLWLAVPGGGDDAAFATRLLDEQGIVVAPGSFLGAAGAGHVRVALVPTLEACAAAAQRLAGGASATMGP